MRHAVLLLAAGLAAPAAAQDCGGEFGLFLDGLKAEAVAEGVSAETAEEFLAGVRQDERVLARDRDQGHFQQDFITFSRRLISQDRVDRVARLAEEHDALFDRIEAYANAGETPVAG